MGQKGTEVCLICVQLGGRENRAMDEIAMIFINDTVATVKSQRSGLALARQKWECLQKNEYDYERASY